MRTKYGGKVFVFSNEDEVKLVVEIDGEESVIHLTPSQANTLSNRLYHHLVVAHGWVPSDAD